MIRVMHEEHAFSDLFLKFLLARSMRTQADWWILFNPALAGDRGSGSPMAENLARLRELVEQLFRISQRNSV